MKERRIRLRKQISEQKQEIERLNREVDSKEFNYDFNKGKIEDDFNLFNQLLEQKTLYYENILFNINRFSEEKKLNVSSEEITKTTENIISETISALSEKYMEYLVDKYFSSLERLIESYNQRIFLRLFEYASKYNIERIRK